MSIDCSNVSSNASTDDRFNLTNSCALFDFALYTIGVGLMVALGVTGNALSFVVLLRERDPAGRGRTAAGGTGPRASATSFLLRALAGADTMVLLAAVPLYVLPPVYPHTGYLENYYRLYITIMPYLWPVYLIPFTGSVFITVLVSVDRYLAVCRPFKGAGGSGGGVGLMRSIAGPLTAARVRCLVGSLSAFAFVYNVPRFFEYRRVEECVGPNDTQIGFEMTEFGAHRLYRIVYANVLYFLFVHGGPLLALAFLNFRLVQALRVRNRRRMEMKNGVGGWVSGSGSREHRVVDVGSCVDAGSRGDRVVIGVGGAGGGISSSRTQRDITLTLVGVICVFIVCQTPTLIDHVLWTVVDKELRQCGGWHYFYTAVGDALAVLNSSVNFGVYVLTSRRFRRGVAIALGCCEERRRSGLAHDEMTETVCAGLGVCETTSTTAQFLLRRSGLSPVCSRPTFCHLRAAVT